MLSPHQAQRLAIRYFEYWTAQGLNMNSWTVLRSHPTKISPKNLVLLSRHTGDDIGTLLKHGIGVDNRVCDLQQVIEIEGKIILGIDPAGSAA